MDRAESNSLRQPGRRAWLALVAPAVLVAVYAAWIGFRLGGERVTTIVDDGGNLAAAGLAAVAAIRRSRVTAERTEAIGWLLLGVGLLLTVLGGLQRSYYEIVLAIQAPGLSPGSVAYLLNGPVDVVAVLLLCGRGLGGLRSRLLLDAGLVTSAVLLISWLTVLQTVSQEGGGPVPLALAVVSAAADVVTAVIVLSTLSHSRSLDPPRLLVLFGLLASAVATSLIAYFIANGLYLGVQLVDAVWFTGYLLLTMAPLAPSGPVPREAPPPARWQLLLPYVPLVGAAGLALGEALAHRPLDLVTVLLVAAMVVLVLARQLTAVMETQALAGRLLETAERWRSASTEREILIESAPVGICRLSDDGRLVTVNRALQEILHRERDDMVGRPLRDLLLREEEGITGVFDGRPRRLSGEAPFLRGDRTVTWCSYATVAVPGGSGRPDSFICIIEDVNERRLEADRAAAIQRQLLPQGTPALPGYELAGVCLPAQNVAGDFYDWVVADGHLDVTVADVMGKGMGAALVMAALRTALRAAPPGLGPAGRIGLAADTMALGLDGLFVTAFLARVDLRTGRLRYVDAGHGHCALRLASGELVHLSTRSLPLGVDPTAAFSEGEVRLEPGDCLLMYSDGLVETEAGTALPDVVVPQLDGAADAAEMLERLTGRVPPRPADDVTAVVLRRLPELVPAEAGPDRAVPSPA